MNQKILIVEDEPAIADNISYALTTEGFEPVWCSTGEEARRALESQSFTGIVLDVGLPDVNGFEFCKEIRKSSNIPILFLTARSDEIDRIIGLEIGGDDYMVKPFSPRELTARIKAILRRANNHQSNKEKPTPSEKMFCLDEQKKQIQYFGQLLDLSKYEYNILVVLLKHPGHVYSRDALMELAWDEPDFSFDRTVDAHIKNLRHKLKRINPDMDPIQTKRGFGYAIRDMF